MEVQTISEVSGAGEARRKRRVSKPVSVPDRMLRPREVVQVVGLSRSTVYRMVQRGEFPKPVRLTDAAIGWPESSVRSWIRKRSGSNVHELAAR